MVLYWMWRAEAGGSQGLAGHQPSFRFSKRFCLNGIRQGAIEKDI